MYWSFVILTGILLLAYGICILQYRKWFLRLPLFSKTTEYKASVFFSVIIPARNEEKNIAACLHSILQQEYPSELFEVIVINDHSTDQTEAIVRNLQLVYSNLRLLNLTDLLKGEQLNAYKKKAIELAIAESRGNWIVTTDADCRVTEKWLSLYNAYICEKEPVFIAAPVMFSTNGSFIALFQLLDFISLQAITAASVSAGYHTMCNGANIAYRKDVFYEVGQFAGIDHIASGDDMLLMHKIKQQYPEGLGYLFAKEAIVLTEPMKDWKSFLNQRIRWASKADQYNDKSIFWVLLLVYILNALLLILFFWSISLKGGIYYWLFLLAAKTFVEITLMLPAARFYNELTALGWFPLMQPFHILYTVIAGWLGKFGTYEWKGRKVR
jgi:cellulose synthase/poly-beta-1,6-N-acetylglucosamine synthase-like glycosyltransferase